MHAVYTHVYHPIATCFTALWLCSFQDLETPELKKFRQRFPTCGKGEWMPYFLELFLFQGDDYLVNDVLICLLLSFWFPNFHTWWLIVWYTFYWIKVITIWGECWGVYFATILGFVKHFLMTENEVELTWKPSCYDVPSSLTKNKPARLAIPPSLVQHLL